MVKHDLALQMLRTELNRTTGRRKYAADRRIWLKEAIDYDTKRRVAPWPKHIRELEEMEAEMKSTGERVSSLIASIQTLEDDDE